MNLCPMVYTFAVFGLACKFVDCEVAKLNVTVGSFTCLTNHDERASGGQQLEYPDGSKHPVSIAFPDWSSAVILHAILLLL